MRAPARLLYSLASASTIVSTLPPCSDSWIYTVHLPLFSPLLLYLRPFFEWFFGPKVFDCMLVSLKPNFDACDELSSG